MILNDPVLTMLLRHQRPGESQNAFARRIGVEGGHWSLLRNGRRTLSRETIERIAANLPEFAREYAAFIAEATVA